jgi:hypothetical protein
MYVANGSQGFADSFMQKFDGSFKITEISSSYLISFELFFL